MELLLKYFKSLSDKNRLRIVGSLINNKELCACEITEFLNISGATASRHLSLLISAGLVTSRKQGKWVYYSLSNSRDTKLVLTDKLYKYISETPQVIEDKKQIKSAAACG